MAASKPERRRARREEIDPAALALIARHGTQVLATARRYSASLEDAEDAYQRALEILLTKAPTTAEAELVPWLKTVVKHEAFAIRRQRERHTPTTDDGEVAEPPTPDTETHEQAERWERLRLGAEAMRRLKPAEVRCLLLKAEGYSYKEICQITGWSYTKVNRSMTEGRRAFLERVAGIEGGGECTRLEPLVSLLADGELSAEELKMLRPHLKTCLACRARLREYRAAPQRVAALVPPVALGAVAGGGADAGPLRSFVETLLTATHDRAHAVAELATGQKVAALAASAAVVAGGGATVSELSTPDGAPQRDQPVTAPAPAPAEEPVVTAPAPTAPTAGQSGVAQPSADSSSPAPAPPPSPAPAPDPANEFTPSPAPASAPARAAPRSAPAPATDAGFAPSGGGGSSGSRSGGEFGP